MGLMFQPDMMLMVLKGEKGQTRRIKKPYEHAEFDENYGMINAVHTSQHREQLKWRVGNTYALVPGRGKKSLARITLHRIRLTTANQINDKDAFAEGFSSRLTFLDRWDLINGKDKRDAPCWALTFSLIWESKVWDPIRSDTQSDLDARLATLTHTEIIRLMVGSYLPPEQEAR